MILSEVKVTEQEGRKGFRMLQDFEIIAPSILI